MEPTSQCLLVKEVESHLPTSRSAIVASQSTVISTSADIGDDISSGKGSLAPPKKPDVTEEWAIDFAVSIRPSVFRLSSLWTLRDSIGLLSWSGGVPTRRSAPSLPVNCRDNAVIFIDGEVERWRSTEHISIVTMLYHIDVGTLLTS
jgi:hypothetical protein